MLTKLSSKVKFTAIMKLGRTARKSSKRCGNSKPNPTSGRV